MKLYLLCGARMQSLDFCACVINRKGSKKSHIVIIELLQFSVTLSNLYILVCPCSRFNSAMTDISASILTKGKLKLKMYQVFFCYCLLLNLKKETKKVHTLCGEIREDPDYIVMVTLLLYLLFFFFFFFSAK